MIKAIVLDLGGVLIDLDVKACRKAFIEILGFYKIDELLDPCHQKGIYSDLEEGKISVDEFRNLVVKDSRPGSDPMDVDRCMGALLTGMDPAKVPFLYELAQRYEIYALSNNNPIAMRRFHEIYEENGLEWKDVFRTEFLSCEMKLLKPDPEIYREALRRIGLPADEILFVDDSQANVDAAASLGINAVHYVPGTDLRETVEPVLNNLNR